MDVGLRRIRRIESRKHGVVVSTLLCGLSECEGAWCVGEFSVDFVFFLDFISILKDHIISNRST